MNKRTRYFIFGAVTVLALGLCTGLVAYFGGFPTSAISRSGGPDELKYVPADAAVVAYANVREVMLSEFRQRLKAVMPDEKGREEFRDKTGIDIENDIDYVVACMLPQDGQNGGIVLARGRFDAVRLELLAREHGGVVSEYQGRRLITTPKGEDGDEPVVAFLEPGVLAVGTDVAVRRAIDAATSARNISQNSEIMSLMTDLSGGGSAWAVGQFDALAKQADLPDNVTRQIPSIKYFAASGRVNGGVSGVFRAEARDEKAAQNLRDVVQGFVALARMQADQNPQLRPLLDSVQLSGQGQTVAISFSVPIEVLDLIAPKAEGASAH
jgi:hypothetical protein